MKSLLVSTFCKRRLTAALVILGATIAPLVSAQTLQLRFNFEDAGTTTADSVAGVSLNLVNGANVLTDYHGTNGSGVAGVGQALDFSSAAVGNGNNPLAYTATNSTVNFGTISTFTVTMWFKPTATPLNFGRFFILGAEGTMDSGGAGSLSFLHNNSLTSIQGGVNAVNPGAVTGLSNIVVGQWNFIAVTYDGGTFRAYTASEFNPVIGGGELANAGGDMPIGSTFNLMIGNRLSNRQRGWPTFIDDVRFYTGAADVNFLENVRKEAVPDPFVSGTTIVPAIAVVGNPVAISAGAGGTAPITYRWQHVTEGGVTNFITTPGPALNIPSVALPDAGTYSLIVSNNPGGVPTVRTNTSATLTVRASASSLTWIAPTGNAWDTTAANWTNVSAGGGLVPYVSGDSVLFDDNGRTNTVNVANASLFPSSVTVSSSSNYTIAGSALSGSMPLTKNGTGTLFLNNGNTYNGNVTINNGILRTGNGGALGTTNGNTTVAAGGTLDVGGANLGLEEFVVQGTGAGGTNGAISNTGGQQQSAISRVVLAGDTTFNSGNTRWDVHGSGGNGYFRGNGFTLTKISGPDIWLKDVGDTGLGNVNIMQGSLGFQGLIGMGDSNATLTANNATLGFWATIPTNLLSKVVVLNNSSIFSGGGANNFHGPVTVTGTNTFNITTDFHMFNGISGSGGIIKSGGAVLTIDGNNSHTGSTFINSGQLTLGANSTLDSSSTIRISPLAILDVNAVPGGLNRASGQTLAGFGSPTQIAYVTGNVTAAGGSTIIPGLTGPGSLYLVGNVSLGGVTIPINLGSDPNQIGGGNDYINVAFSLNLSGVNTIQISPVGPLAEANYTIINHGGLSGGMANLAVTSANPRYAFSIVDPATTPGAIQVAVSGVPTPLVWKGGKAPGPNIWNHSITNFLNTGTGMFDRFYDGDIVTFDDTAVTNIINVTETNAPGSLTFVNNSLNYRFEGNGNLAGTLAKLGTGSVTLAMSNSPNFFQITNNAGALIFDLPVSNATVSAAIFDDFSGQGSLIQNSTNQLTLSGDNSSYFGQILVNNGVLRYTTIPSLGSGTDMFVTNGTGTLNIGNVVAVTTGTKNIHIKGAGFNGQGAINGGAGGGPVPMMTGTLTLDGDATIAANPRWDFASGSTFVGNGFTLTKTGPADIWMITVNNATMGDVHIVQGVLGFQQGTSMGDPTKTITVESNSACGLWDNQAVFLEKNIVLNGSAAITSGGNTNTLLGPVTLVSNNTLTVNTDLHLNGAIGGSGGFVKGGGGTLYLNGANTYSGPTTIGANSQVVLGPGSSVGSSSQIQIDGGSTLNATNLASFNLGAGQTVIGNGTLRGQTINFGSGSTLSPSFSGFTGTLNVFGNLTFQNNSEFVVKVNKTVGIANDRVVGPTLATFGGTLVINITGNPLAGGDVIPLISATNYAGTVPAIIPATPGAGLTWDTSTLLTDGTLRVSGGAVQPQLTPPTVSGGNFVFRGSGGTPGADYSILSHTNVSAQLANWSVVGGGMFDGSGNFSFTNPITAGTNRYYILRVP